LKDPIQHLLEEHVEIMREVAGLRSAVAELEAGGESALPAVRGRLESVARMMTTRLAVHARKEDEVLFPAVEVMLGEGFGPTAVMREEHRQIHGEAARFRETLRELNEVEHPAIVAGGKALGRLARSGGAVDLARTAAEIVNLLDRHFAKEEQILFPLCRQMLSPGALAEIGARIEAIAAESPPPRAER
jgi:iron-sulfur cluster repair protein YtfE (RIC family)